MARIVLTTYGSSGDLNPIVALGLGLQARGHVVLIAVEEVHRPSVVAAGLAVHPLPGDNEAVLLPYRRVLFGDISPVAFTRILLEHSILPTLHETVEALRVACEGADLLVSTMQQAAAGTVADVTGLPWVSLALSPLAIPSASVAPYPLPAALPPSVQSVVNRAIWAAARHTGRRLSDEALNRVRAQYGLPPRRDALLRGNRSPLLAAVAVSPAFFHPPTDWPPQARTTGFLFWDAPTAWVEPAALADFLADPRPVVAVSSGSMSPLVGDVFADFYQTSVAAIQRAGARALVIGASPAALPEALPADVLAVPFAPFSTVYPRCAAVIHHGGIGTTAQGLRASTPALVAPWGVDQHFDAAQVARLGTGRWLPRRRYTVTRAAQVLAELLHQPVYRAQAHVMASQIAREDGVATLCAEIEDILNTTTLGFWGWGRLGGGGLLMIAAYAPLVAPPSAQPPTPNLAPRDVERLADDLVAYHARFAPLFQRTEQRRAALLYLQGQLLDLERKTIEPLAHAVVGGDVQALQQFIGQSPWDAEAVLHAHQAYVGETLGDAEEGAFIIDGCDVPKQGTESVGVARPWCGPLGKRANCQSGVVICYASPRGYTLVDRRLYLPEPWFTPAYAARRRRCGVPPDVTFRTHPELAGDMVAGLRARGQLPARWAHGDEGFGRDTALLDRLAAEDLWYMAEVPHTTRVWLERPAVSVPAGTGQGRPRTRARVDAAAPAPVEVGALAAALPPTAWRRHLLNEGAKGPQVAEVACVRAVAVRDRLPGPDVWVVLRRGLGSDAELKAFLSNAPADLPAETLAQRSAARWPVERGIEEGKGEVGLDHYEVRGWVGWHHHVTLSFLAHHFLVQARLHLGGKKPGPDRAPGARPAPGRATPAHADPAARARPAARHPAPEPQRLPLPSQAYPPSPPRFILTT